jgi:hypothetical protein
MRSKAPKQPRDNRPAILKRQTLGPQRSHDPRNRLRIAVDPPGRLAHAVGSARIYEGGDRHVTTARSVKWMAGGLFQPPLASP